MGCIAYTSPGRHGNTIISLATLMVTNAYHHASRIIEAETPAECQTMTVTDFPANSHSTTTNTQGGQKTIAIKKRLLTRPSTPAARFPFPRLPRPDSATDALSGGQSAARRALYLVVQAVRPCPFVPSWNSKHPSSIVKTPEAIGYERGRYCRSASPIREFRRTRGYSGLPRSR
jgi:hypothetical protein